MSSRVILPVLGGLSVPGTAICGFVLSGKYSTDAVLPETFDEFQREEELENCLQNLFPGIINIKNDSENAKVIDGNGTNKVDTSTFTTSVVSSGTNTDGCLMVNGDKEYVKLQGDDWKWKGNGRFLWAMKKGDKGFIVFNTLTTSNNSDKNLVWEGQAYVLNREDRKHKGKITMKLGTEKNKKIDKSAVDTKFPKANSSLPGMKNHDMWNFMSNKNNLEQICTKDEECPNLKHVKSPFRGYWKGKEDTESSATAKDWSSTISAWGKEIYPVTKGNIEQAFSEFKGSGEEVYISGLKPKAQESNAVA